MSFNTKVIHFVPKLEFNIMCERLLKTYNLIIMGKQIQIRVNENFTSIEIVFRTYFLEFESVRNDSFAYFSKISNHQWQSQVRE